jgi:hypothetical protein
MRKVIENRVIELKSLIERQELFLMDAATGGGAKRMARDLVNLKALLELNLKLLSNEKRQAQLGG